MKPLSKDLSDELKKRNLRVSTQRIKILEYLICNRNHQTADQIYNALHPDLPTLSKTTVYNTLKALTQAGMVRELDIDDHETRYDIARENHGHFKCESCGTIYDFAVDMKGLLKNNDLIGFQIRDRNVYLKGLCPRCLLDKEGTR